MNNIINFYNRNRKKIWGILIAAIVIIAIIYYLISDFSNRNEQSLKKKSEFNNLTNNLNSVSITTQNSVITGKSLDVSENMLKVIDNFVEYCNNSELEKAYNLLSDNCKNELYSSLELFQNLYYNSIFAGEKKSVTIENWFGDIYKVSYNEDFLATGKYSKENVKQDYITIVKQNDEYKLNINKLVTVVNYNKEAGSDDINVKLNKIVKYMDYEIYEFNVTNKTKNTISLGNLDEEYSMYLLGDNNLKYGAYIHELSDAEISISSYQEKKVKIKYYSKYSSTKDLKQIVFPNIILDYKTYIYNPDSYNGGYKYISIDI